jgi:hypothetical protein
VLPQVYVRLVYCLGYGKDEVCYPRPPENNRGTDDFWEIFERIATSGERHRGKPLPAPRNQLAGRIAILERLAERGIWLEDASPIGLYLPAGGRLTYDGLIREVIVRGLERLRLATVRCRPTQTHLGDRTDGQRCAPRHGRNRRQPAHHAAVIRATKGP